MEKDITEKKQKKTKKGKKVLLIIGIVLVALIAGIMVLAGLNGGFDDPLIYYGISNDGTHAYVYANTSEADKLTEAVIKDTYSDLPVTEIIGFHNCTNLVSITIPESITKIKSSDGDVFARCENLTNVYYAGTIEGWAQIEFNSIGSNPLCYAKNLYVNNDALVTEVSITNATKISDYAFYGYANLTGVTLSDNVESIGADAFYGCTSLASVALGNGVKSIGVNAFKGCSSLTSITIPASVNELGGGAFSNCTALVEINYNATDSNITNNYESPFYAAGQLTTETKLTIGTNVKKLNGAFNDSYITEVTVGDNSALENLDGLSKCYRLASVNIGSGNAKYRSNGGVVYNADLTEIVSVPAAIRGAVIIPYGVTKISDGDFKNCHFITSITVPNTVTSVKAAGVYSLFEGCSKLMELIDKTDLSLGNYANGNALVHKESSKIVNNNGYEFITDIKGNHYLLDYTGTETELVLPSDYNGEPYSIKEYAFSLRNNITSVTISEGVKSVGEYAFANCYNLTNVVLSNGITAIESHVFRGCIGLTSITIPNSVASIGYNSFYACINLKDVYYAGTQEQWTKIGKENAYSNEQLYKATVHYSSQGESGEK